MIGDRRGRLSQHYLARQYAARHNFKEPPCHPNKMHLPSPTSKSPNPSSTIPSASSRYIPEPPASPPQLPPSSPTATARCSPRSKFSPFSGEPTGKKPRKAHSYRK